MDSPVDEQITLGWRYAYDNLNPQAAMAFLTGSSPFEIYGAPIAEDALMVDAGLSWPTLPRNLNFCLSIMGNWVARLPIILLPQTCLAHGLKEDI